MGDVQQIMNMPINNIITRQAKATALHNYMKQQNIDTIAFEDGIVNFRQLSASDQNFLIENMTRAIDDARPHSPSYPFAMSEDEGEVVAPQDIDMGDPQVGSYSSTKEDTDDQHVPPPPPPPPAPPVVDLTPEDRLARYNVTNMTETFAPYQQRINDMILEIERFQPTSQTTRNREFLQTRLLELYEIFYGHTPTAEGQQLRPTPFYLKNGAAPICGMNPFQFEIVGRRMQQVRGAIAFESENVLGSLFDMIVTIAHSNQGVGRNAPFKDMAALVKVIRLIQQRGQALIEADPLFIAHRAKVVEQGDLAVLPWYRRFLQGVAYFGIDNFRAFLGQIGLSSLQRIINESVRAKWADAAIAITNFEAALAEYDKIYQRLPVWAQTCWTLPYARTQVGRYNSDLAQSNPSANKYGGNNATGQVLIDARGELSSLDLEQYPAFLTLDGHGQPNGPLMAYYAALWGGQQQFLQKGRDYLNSDFFKNPENFLAKVQPLLDFTNRTAQQRQQQGKNIPMVMSPRTAAHARSGDMQAVTNKISAVAGGRDAVVGSTSTAYSDPGWLGTGQEGQMFHPGTIPMQAKDVAAMSQGSDLQAFQDQQRIARERQVQVEQETQNAIAAAQRLQQGNEKELREGLETGLRQAARDLFNQKGGERGHENWTNLRQLINTPLNLNTNQGVTQGNGRNLWQIMMGLFLNNTTNLLRQYLTEVSAQGRETLEHRYGALGFLDKRMRPDGGGVELLIGWFVRQIAIKARTNDNLALPWVIPSGEQIFLTSAQVQQLNTHLQSNPLARRLGTQYSNSERGHQAWLTQQKKQSRGVFMGKGGRRTRKYKKRKTKRHHRRGKKTRHKRRKRTRKH